MPPLPRLFAATLVPLAALCTLGTGTAWAVAEVPDTSPKVVTFRLDDPSASTLPLLEVFHEAALAHPSRASHYSSGAWARWGREPWWALSWLAPASEALHVADVPGLTGLGERRFGFDAPDLDAGMQALNLLPSPSPAWLGRVAPRWTPLTTVVTTPAEMLASDGIASLWSLPPSKPTPDWRCRRRPVQFVRQGGETDAFRLVRCDGTVAEEALDRLTLMARAISIVRPGDLLPDEPDPAVTARGEWLPGIRVVHPRMLWLLQRIADAFPWRTVYVVSAYRPRHGADALAPPRADGGHGSLHGAARAMDIHVVGVPNEALYKVCRELDDVGCGYYPNSTFVHVDVRRPGTGHAFWIDESGPGEPAHYVDSWPGVVESGALVWDPAHRDAGADAPFAR